MIRILLEVCAVTLALTASANAGVPGCNYDAHSLYMSAFLVNEFFDLLPLFRWPLFRVLLVSGRGM